MEEAFSSLVEAEWKSVLEIKRPETTKGLGLLQRLLHKAAQRVGAVTQKSEGGAFRGLGGQLPPAQEARHRWGPRGRPSSWPELKTGVVTRLLLARQGASGRSRAPAVSASGKAVTSPE